ncbi:MAG: sigma-70 family RNA polymerase sigma factor [Gemmataceae bacterium]
MKVQKKRRHYLAAVVLGTALAAMGSSQASASEGPGRSINDVSRYCSACWRNARLPLDRWGDCTQDVLSRLLQRVPLTSWTNLWNLETPERRELLRAIDAVKKRAQRERKRGSLADDFATVDDAVARNVAEERAAVAQAADRLLSPRQQRILQMTCEGWTIPDMATELDLSAQRVSDEKYKAIQKLRTYFQEYESRA